MTGNTAHFKFFSVLLIKWPGTGDFNVYNPPWKVRHGYNKLATEGVKASNMNSSEDSSITSYHIHTIHKVIIAVCFSFD